ncbi:hypothetical protein UPYG_G00184890 [Umbra pygmaea]|uniref:FIP-RBD domain-containing protein n=1 Tax=Umbra pygmaea TaxID=75934 RepID=A0ABD0WVY0_UMBPY
MHRALVGLDKLLGQAVINLLDLHDNKGRQKTDWYKLLDKNGKEDKNRGEVNLDIQFMRNNLTASMFDLSIQDKPRSRLGKLKDKVRGKKKDGFSDSASAIVPSSSQGLTDSEGEGDSNSLSSESTGAKKKSKLKSIFGSKSNLQRNVSQSMSTLGTLPEKNAYLSGSRSSGLNVDSPDVKKKFKFLGHKRTGSNDSKVSTGPFSLLGRSKQKEDPNSTCINGNHVYAEEVEPKSGSTLSINSSGQGSVEDVRSRRHPSDASIESLKGLSVPSYRTDPADGDRALLEQRRIREEDEKKRAEEKRLNEEKHRAQLKILQEEEEQKQQEKRRFQEEQERGKKQREEKRRAEEAELQRLEEEQKRQEEAKRTEDQKRQEEASVTERFTSLFGMIRKKEEKEDTQQNDTMKERPDPTPRQFSKGLEVPAASHAANPFEEIPLSADSLNLVESQGDKPKPVQSSNTLNSAVFLNPNRTAKVSAVKPRLTEALKQPETCELDSHRQEYPSPSCPKSPLSSVPSEAPDMSVNLHSSFAPSTTRRSSSESPYSSTEKLTAVGSSTSRPDKKRHVPLPPNTVELKSHGKLNAGTRSVSATSSDTDGHLVTIKEVDAKMPPLPLPDYNSLFTQKRHGIQGQIRWDHVIAEVNQRQQEYTPQLIGEEMSVDGPDFDYTAPQDDDNDKPVKLQDRRSQYLNQQQTQLQEGQSMPLRGGKSSSPALIPPPKPVHTVSHRLVGDSNAKHVQRTSQAVDRDNSFTSKVLVSTKPSAHSRDLLSMKPLEDVRKRLNIGSASHGKTVFAKQSSRPTSAEVLVSSASDETKGLPNNPKEIPKARPRQNLVNKEPVRRTEPETVSALSSTALQKNGSEMMTVSTSNAMTWSSPVMTINDSVITNSEKEQPSSSAERNNRNVREHTKQKIAEPDPFTIAESLPTEPWDQPDQRPSGDELFTRGSQKERLVEKGVITDNNPTNFSNCNNSDSEEYLEEPSPAFQRGFSQRKKPTAPPHPVNLSSYRAKGKREPSPIEVRSEATASDKLVSQAEDLTEKRQSNHCVREKVETDPKEEKWIADPCTTSSPMPSALISPEPSLILAGESCPQTGAEGKTLQRAWVSPSEMQPVTMLSSNEGGPASTPRRPHPVKPMNSMENQATISTPTVREMKTYDGSVGKMKVPGLNESGPYTQLTQEELITLVVKQQTEISKKDSKITELEEYIDNLLVRVIEEKPSILLGLNSAKQAL